jgi:hypothetical protein
MTKKEMLAKLADLRAAQTKITLRRQQLRAEIALREKEDDKALAISIGFAVIQNRSDAAFRAALEALSTGSRLKAEHVALVKDLLSA